MSSIYSAVLVELRLMSDGQHKYRTSAT